MNSVTVVGIGADGYAGLGPQAREAVDAAGVVVGGHRQLELLPDSVTAQRVPWPSPLRPAVRPLVEQHRDRGLVVLASGDPMHHGIGRTLFEELGPGSVRVLTHPSSVALACARLGWPVEATPVVSTLTAGLESVLRYAGDGRRLLVLNRDSSTPPALAALLTERGFGASRLLVLADLGGPDESSHQGLAEQADYWSTWPPRPTGQSPLGPSLTALQLAGPPALPETPGLPDDAYWHDGQLTKRHVRAITLAALAPRPGEQLWDVGGGSGSIAIEWLRAHPTTQALTVERDETRIERISRNAALLGVPHLRVVTGAAPAALSGLPAPDAVFIGGGLTTEGVFDACWSALREGGRLVANAVTLESQAEVTRLAAQHGGELVKVEIAGTTPVGGFTGWRPSMPVVQWTVVKGLSKKGLAQ